MHASEALHPWWGYNAKQDIKTETISGIHHILQSMLSSSGEKVQLPRTPVSLLLLLVTSVVSDSLPPHRQQPTRLPCPWDSPGRSTGVGCHFLLECMKVKVKSLSCVQPLATPMDCSLPGSSIHGIFQARVLEAWKNHDNASNAYVGLWRMRADQEVGIGHEWMCVSCYGCRKAPGSETVGWWRSNLQQRTQLQYHIARL